MSIDDFDRCTPFEFTKIVEQWQRQKEEYEKRSWEQSRFIATCVLQPYSKKALKPTDVARFPWDDPGPKVEKGHGSIERMRELEARLKAAEEEKK